MKKLLVLSFCLFSILSCTKEKYSGTQSFWYNQDTANDLTAYGISQVTLYVDGTLVKTMEADDYFNADPGCGSGNFVYTDNAMFKRENKTHAYRIVDEMDSLIWEGVFQTNQGKCNSIQLTK